MIVCKIKLLIIIFIIVVCPFKRATAQVIYQYTFFSTANGLPSNNLYKIVQDKKGFFWISTENGLSRFDGRNFKNYTTADGLPDNEVLQMEIEDNGTMWVQSFGKPPAFYNPITDKFEGVGKIPGLENISPRLPYINTLQSGGIAFSGMKGSSFIYKENKLTELQHNMKNYHSNYVMQFNNTITVAVVRDSLLYFKNGYWIKSVALQFVPKNNYGAVYSNKNLFIADGNVIAKYGFDAMGEAVTFKIAVFPFKISLISMAGKELLITTVNGNAYLADTTAISITNNNLYSNAFIRYAFVDTYGSYWLCAREKGLIKVTEKKIFSPENKSWFQNFNTVNVAAGKIMAGTNNGDIIINDGLYGTKQISLFTGKELSGWTRKIITIGNHYFVSNQAGSFLLSQNFKKEKAFINNDNYAGKTASAYNDSVLIMGNHGACYLFNINSKKIEKQIKLRTNATMKSAVGNVYLGSTGGLYRWDADSLFYFGEQHKALSNRVSAIAETTDGLLWAGLGSDSVIILKNDIPIAAIAVNGATRANACKCLLAGTAGIMWMGTNNGICKINYQWNKQKFTYTTTGFTNADGLLGDEVNDLCISNDTLYAATSGGINFMSTKIAQPYQETRAWFTKVKINGRDTSLLSTYNIPYNLNDILIEFMAPDFSNNNLMLYQYRINKKDWITTKLTALSLSRLSPGDYSIAIRTLGPDGKPANTISTLKINIRPAWWQNTVYRITGLLVLLAILVYGLKYYYTNKRKKVIDTINSKNKLQLLELQALKTQINPHFIFNCLNSIKFLTYQKKYKSANLYLDKFSYLLRATLDNAAVKSIRLQEEIKFIENYLDLEKLRFNDTLNYSIAVADDVNAAEILLPSMLLQPYIENSIRHGIRHLTNRRGQIDIVFSKQQYILVCTVTDNGVGRTRSTFINNHHAPYRPSYGLEMQQKRADLYGVVIKIEDVTDEKDNVTGTKVILQLPSAIF